MSRRTLSILALLTMALSTAWVGSARAAQPKHAVHARVDRHNLVIEEEIELILKVYGVYEAFENPALPDFETVGRYSRERNVLDDFGNMDKFREVAFRLRPRRVGKLTIGSARLKVGGKVVAESKPIEIEVANVPGPISAAEARDLKRHKGRRMFLQAAAAQDTYYEGQPFVVGWDLYYHPDLFVIPQNVAVAPRFEGLRTQELPVEPGDPRDATVGGKKYKLRPYTRTLMIPLHPGERVIGSMRVNTTVEDRFPNAQVRSSAFKLKILPLPEGQPDGFKAGHVGRFKMTSKLTHAQHGDKLPDALGPKDKLVLDVSIEGDGNLEGLEPPDLVDAELWQSELEYVRDAERIRKSPEGISGNRAFRFVLTPLQPGKHPTPRARVVYFDPSAKAYETLLSESRTVEVETTMNPIMGGLTVGDLSRSGAHIELGWPGLKTTFALPVTPLLDLGPQLNVRWGLNLQTGLVGIEPGAELRYTVFKDGPVSLALLSDPGLLFWIPTAKKPVMAGIRVGIPGLVGGWQAASTVTLLYGLRLPLALSFNKRPLVQLPVLANIGVEVQVHRSPSAIVNLTGIVSGGPAFCLANCEGPERSFQFHATELMLDITVGSSVVW